MPYLHGGKLLRPTAFEHESCAFEPSMKFSILFDEALLFAIPLFREIFVCWRQMSQSSPCFFAVDVIK